MAAGGGDWAGAEVAAGGDDWVGAEVAAGGGDWAVAEVAAGGGGWAGAEAGAVVAAREELGGGRLGKWSGEASVVWPGGAGNWRDLDLDLVHAGREGLCLARHSSCRLTPRSTRVSREGQRRLQAWWG